MMNGAYIMGEDTQLRKQICEQCPNVVYIPFIQPPYHLLATQYADIGVLTYVSSKRDLNALHCAPNKLFEYSVWGLPMIGNNIPRLAYPFEKYNIGVYYEHLKKYEII